MQKAPTGGRTLQVQRRIRVVGPGPSLEQTPRPLLPFTAPLLEKKDHLLLFADSMQLLYPLLLHRSRTRTTFATDDRPMYAAQVGRGNCAKQRFERHKANAGRHLAQNIDAFHVILTLDRRTKPDVGQRWELRFRQKRRHAIRPLG